MGIKGQTVIEYIVLIGIITVALFYMGPLFKRGVQSLVKVTSDQIGNQEDADQEIAPRDFADPVEGVSYLVNSSTNTESIVNKLVRDGIQGQINGQMTDLGYMDIGVSENTEINSESETDLGYTPRQ